MASLFGTAIVAVCASTVQIPYIDACNKALDAATRHLGYRQNVDFVEDGLTNYANAKIERSLSQEQLSALGTTFFTYKVVRDKKLSFRLPNLGICNSARNEITPDSYSLFLEWRF